MGAADHRQYLANKLWRTHTGYTGWTAPHFTLSKKDEAAISFWDKRGHIERDGKMIRMTDAGRAALTAATSHKAGTQ